MSYTHILMDLLLKIFVSFPVPQLYTFLTGKVDLFGHTVVVREVINLGGSKEE